MHHLRKALLVIPIIAVAALGIPGCAANKSDSAAPTSSGGADHPKADHPKGDHPSGEHPK